MTWPNGPQVNQEQDGVIEAIDAGTGETPTPLPGDEGGATQEQQVLQMPDESPEEAQ